MVFQLTDNPPARGLVILVLAIAVATVAAILGAAFYVGGDWEGALWVAGTLLAMAMAFALGAWLINRGEVNLTNERLEVRSVGNKQSAAWGDIAGARVRTVAELGMIDNMLSRMAGGQRSRRVVEIQTKRPLRSAVLPWEHDGPDALGPPAFPRRMIRVYVRDPEGLVRAINAHRGRRGGP